MSDRHPDDDLLIDLALSNIDEPQRDALTGHLALCEPCRARYATIADSVDHVLAAAPPVAPPPGFSQRALAAMGIAEVGPPVLHDAASGVGSSASGQSGRAASASAGSSAQDEPLRTTAAGELPQRRGARRVWLVGLAAALAVLVGAVGTAVLLDRTEESPAEVAAVGPALVTRDGTRVGTVLDSRYEGKQVLVVTISQGPVGAHYDCRLVLADGSRQEGGSWVLEQESGVTWVIDHPGDDVTGIELVADSGRTWATATL